MFSPSFQVSRSSCWNRTVTCSMPTTNKFNRTCRSRSHTTSSPPHTTREYRAPTTRRLYPNSYRSTGHVAAALTLLHRLLTQHVSIAHRPRADCTRTAIDHFPNDYRPSKSYIARCSCLQCCRSRIPLYSCSITCNVARNNLRGGQRAIFHAMLPRLSAPLIFWRLEFEENQTWIIINTIGNTWQMVVQGLRTSHYPPLCHWPLHSQEWSISNFSCSLTRNIASHNMKNLAFHSLLGWKRITLPILTASLIHCSLYGWENVLRGKDARSCFAGTYLKNS